MSATDEVNLSLEEVHELSRNVLIKNGFSVAHAEAIARVITAGQRDECQSHGVYRLLVCVRSLREGKVQPAAIPTLTDRSAAIVAVDAHQGFSLLAFENGLPVLAKKAKEVGIAALVINNCFHFSALWPEVEAIAAHGLAALALTPSHSWVAPAGGTKPVFGTNPVAFAWPRRSGNPFVFDFATSAIARGDIELHRRSSKEIPLGWAVDADGKPTTNPTAALAGAMLTFGGHKGSALSAMVELLGGALIGDMISKESMAFDEGVGASPCHGELIIAFDPELFSNGRAEDADARAEKLFDAIVGQGARLPSQRRFDARPRSHERGVTIPRALFDDIQGLLA
ncbi:Ldh family oxidoreductase [Pseudomonas sp. MOB-449]|nr:Ldh family oxidoreductase [Pseudomonas sp. MOB-449]